MNDKIKDFFNLVSANWAPDYDEELLRSLFLETKMEEGKKALDVGCGMGIITPLLYDITKVKVTAIDIADKMIDGARVKFKDNPHYEFICGDFYDYEFSELYDYVVMYNCYPHFLDIKKLELKSYDILNDNGLLIIMHSLGREMLKKHHEHIYDISRELLPANKEAEFYINHFDIIKTIDEDDRYLIVLRKK